MLPILLISSAIAAEGDSISFAPWNGASFIASEDGESLAFSLSTPIGDSGMIGGLQAAAPVSLASSKTSGAYSVRATLGYSTQSAPTQVFDALLDMGDPNAITTLNDALGGTTTDAHGAALAYVNADDAERAEVRAAVAGLAPKAPEESTRDRLAAELAARLEWDAAIHRAIDAQAALDAFGDAEKPADAVRAVELRREEYAAVRPGGPLPPGTDRIATLDAEIRAHRDGPRADDDIESARQLVRVYDDLVADLPAAEPSAEVRATVEQLENYEATLASTRASPLDELAAGERAAGFFTFSGSLSAAFDVADGYASSAAPEPEAFADSETSLVLQFQGYARRTVGAGFDVACTVNSTYSRTPDDLDPDRVIVGGPDQSLTPCTFAGQVVIVGSQKDLSAKGADATLYYPLLEIRMAGSVTKQGESPIDYRADAHVIAGMRPVGNGAGFGAGLTISADRDRFKTLPIAYISGELPDLGRKDD